LKIVYLGTRSEVLQKCIDLDLELVYGVLVSGSRAEQFFLLHDLPYRVINKENKHEIFEYLTRVKCDLIVSCGLPYIIPSHIVERIGNNNIINFHPSLLPKYKGLHPVTGTILDRSKTAGVTCHFIDSGLDTGNILLQEEIGLSDEIDADLLYQILFRVEARLFEQVVRILTLDPFGATGHIQNHEDSVYYRQKNDRFLRFSDMDSCTILTIIRAFANPRLGAIMKICSQDFPVFYAERISNRYLLSLYGESIPGDVLLVSAFWLLIKVRDGIVKIRKESTWRDNIVEGSRVE